MLGVLRVIGSAVAAAAGFRSAEASVTAVAVLHGMPYGRGLCRRAERWRGRKLGGEPVGEEGGRPPYALRWQVCRQGPPYDGGGDVALQPRGDAGGQVGGVAGGEEQARVVAAQAR